MERAKVKNEIVLMRNVVKRVKVQVIRQMTRQVKKLRAKKGTEQQVEKNTRRVERLLAELEGIKDLVADDVSRQAFFGKLSFDIKSQEDDTLKRATSRIVQHKIIQERVTSLREQGVLTSSINLKELDKKTRRKKKQTPMDLSIEKTNSLKDSNENDENIGAKDEDGNDTEDSNSSEDSNIANDTDDDVSESDDEGEDKPKTSTNPKIHLKENMEIEQQDSVKQGTVSDFFMKGSSDDDDIDVEKSDKDLKVDVSTQPEIPKAQQSQSKKTKKTSKKEDKGQSNLKGMRGRREQLEENTRTAFRKRAVEAKVALVDRPNSTTTPTDIEKNILGISDLPPGLDTNEFSKDQPIEGSIPGMKRQFPKHVGNNSISAYPSCSSNAASNRKPHKEKPAEKLHPSWEAKRKQKEQSTKILPFQGTKITFDD